MPDQGMQILIGIYVLWIAGIVLTIYLMWADLLAAFVMIKIVVWGSNGIALLFVLYAIADAAGAL